jgi:membrane protein YdbS with pleckstrin-like domain
MADAPVQDWSLEIRRRLKEVYKRSLYFLIPFALTTLGAWAHAPRPVLIVSFAAIFVGLAIWMISYYKLSRCPACSALLLYLFQLPALYERCPYCHAPFRTHPHGSA